MTRLFSRKQLQRDGFVGFCRWNDLDNQAPPDAPGVYLVLRESTMPPQFLDASPAGRFKRRDPTVNTATLHDAWIPGCTVLYIGKATSLRTRLRQYHDHGHGQPVGHWGGRYIWQLVDSADLLVCWRVTHTASPAHVEAEMVAAFLDRYGRLTFANLKRQ